LSANTRPTVAVRRPAPKSPGEPSGPMGLPISYNIKEYRIKEESKAGKGDSVIKPVRRRANSGASRYKKNKLLCREPIE